MATTTHRRNRLFIPDFQSVTAESSHRHKRATFTVMFAFRWSNSSTVIPSQLACQFDLRGFQNLLSSLLADFLSHSQNVGRHSAATSQQRMAPSCPGWRMARSNQPRSYVGRVSRLLAVSGLGWDSEEGSRSHLTEHLANTNLAAVKKPIGMGLLPIPGPNLADLRYVALQAVRAAGPLQSGFPWPRSEARKIAGNRFSACAGCTRWRADLSLLRTNPRV